MLIQQHVNTANPYTYSPSAYFCYPVEIEHITSDNIRMRRYLTKYIMMIFIPVKINNKLKGLEARQPGNVGTFVLSHT